MNRRIKHPKYPIVDCDKHTGMKPEAGFLVCPHVFSGSSSPSYVQLPARGELGQITCSQCSFGPKDDLTQDQINEALKNFVIACASCCREKGLLSTLN